MREIEGNKKKKKDLEVVTQVTRYVLDSNPYIFPCFFYFFLGSHHFPCFIFFSSMYNNLYGVEEIKIFHNIKVFMLESCNNLRMCITR